VDRAADGSGPALTVVLAEDDAFFRGILAGILTGWGYRVVEASDGEEAWTAIEKEEAPLLITDWRMPLLDGIDLCRRIRSGRLAHYVYTLVITARGEKEAVVEGFDAGADDYLTKPLEAEELRARMRAGERVVRLEAELRRARSRLEVMASTDELTGVPNRREILARLRAEVALRRRSRSPLSVAIVDADHFKSLNDGFGHAVGDDVLREIVRRLLTTKREYDIVGRLGGEEFLVILPSTSATAAAHVAERLRSSVSEVPFTVPGAADLHLSVSIGVAEAIPEADGSAGRGGTPEALLARADAALYEAKRRGRDRVVEAVSAAGGSPGVDPDL
jgi:diguanylate cyclase (GGDEF)-like protein